MYRKKNLKIITGLNNFNIHKVIEVVNAADIAGATYLDIAANRNVVREVKKNTTLPICVSSISLQDLYLSAVEGVDMLEIGNYDIFYNQGIFLSKQYILNLAKEALKIFNGLDICVTIPYTLSLNEQIQLSCQLEFLGIKVLQTEGLKIQPVLKYNKLTDLINTSLPVLSSTYAISKAVRIPVIAASGVNCSVASLAMLYGASGVGIGTAVINCSNSLSKFIYMVEVINSINSKRITSDSNIVSSTENCSSLLA